MRLATCNRCGNTFEPSAHRRSRHVATLCENCGPRHGDHRDSEYRRNRDAILKAKPPCFWCAQKGVIEPATTADHLVPTSAGGTHARSNLVPSCDPCNKARSNAPGPPPRSSRAKVASTSQATRLT